MPAKWCVTLCAGLFARRPEIDLEKDTPELAALVREGMDSRHKTHKNGDIQKILAKVRSHVGE
jgi:hypothetical protein